MATEAITPSRAMIVPPDKDLMAVTIGYLRRGDVLVLGPCKQVAVTGLVQPFGPKCIGHIFVVDAAGERSHLSCRHNEILKILREREQ